MVAMLGAAGATDLDTRMAYEFRQAPQAVERQALRLPLHGLRRLTELVGHARVEVGHLSSLVARMERSGMRDPRSSADRGPRMREDGGLGPPISLRFIRATALGPVRARHPVPPPSTPRRSSVCTCEPPVFVD